MREYRSEEIRNIALVGHGGSGKTTLTDALVHASGGTNRTGSIRDGTTLTDSTEEEIARGYSINLGCAFAEWNGAKINLLDTPGFMDFLGDATAGLAAADGALLCVSAASGVEVGTEVMFQEAVARRDPVLFVVTMMDRDGTDFGRVYDEIKARLTTRVVPVEIPLGEGAALRGVMNLFARKAYIYSGDGRGGTVEEVDIPESERETFDRYREELIEAISASDDALLERYLDGEEIGRDEAIAGMKEAMKRAELFPLFCVSATVGVGVRALLTELVQLMPSAYEMEELHAFTGAEGEATVEIHADDAHPFAAQVFKTVSEAHVGDVSYFRVFAGQAVTGQEVYNATRDVVEKLGHLSVPRGRERVEVPVLHAGDIGCVAKLRNTHTNDTLSTRDHPVRLPLITFPDTLVSFSVYSVVRGEEEKLIQGLHRLHDEDPSLQLHFVPETHETILSGSGERHLEIALAKLQRKFGVQAELRRPRIAYRETITAQAEGQGRHKKQTGGRGQFGDCWVRLRPAERGAGYRFHDRITGGVIPGKYIPAVDRGIQDASERGVLAGYPLVDFECELYDGSYHSVDSNEMSFRMAGILAFRAVAQRCQPVLLEPMNEVEVLVPDSYLGDIMGDLAGRRGQILGTEAGQGGTTAVRAIVPEAELHMYASTLHSLSHGRGRFSRRFSSYEAVPPEVAQKVIAEGTQLADEGAQQAGH